MSLARPATTRWHGTRRRPREESAVSGRVRRARGCLQVAQIRTPKAQGVGGLGKRLGPVAAGGVSEGGRWGRPGTPALRLPAASSPRPKEELRLGAAGARRRRERAVEDTVPSRCGCVDQARGGVAGSTRRPESQLPPAWSRFVWVAVKMWGAGEEASRSL